MFYVYNLIDSSTGKIFYVGKGKGDRMYRHVQKVKRGQSTDNPHLDRKIKKLLREGKEVHYVKSWIGESEEEAFKQEDNRIQELGIENLCNVWFGGKGGRVPTHEVREKISKRKKGKPLSDKQKQALKALALINKGRKHTEDWKRQQSELKKGIQSEAQKQANEKRGNRGKTFTEDHKQKLRLAKLNNPVRYWKDKRHSEETKEKIRKAVKQTLEEKKNEESITGQ